MDNKIREEAMSKIEPKLIYPFAMGEQLWEARGIKTKQGTVNVVQFFMKNVGLGELEFTHRFTTWNVILGFPPKTDKQRLLAEAICVGLVDAYNAGENKGWLKGRASLQEELKGLLNINTENKT